MCVYVQAHMCLYGIVWGCVYAYVCYKSMWVLLVHLHGCVHNCVGMKARNWPQVSSSIALRLFIFSIFFFFLDLDLSGSARIPGQWALDTVVSGIRSTGITKAKHYDRLKCGFRSPNSGLGAGTTAICSRETSTVPYLLIFIMNFFLKSQYIWLKYVFIWNGIQFPLCLIYKKSKL